jgi:hypothetical protein
VDATDLGSWRMMGFGVNAFSSQSVSFIVGLLYTDLKWFAQRKFAPKLL